MCKGEGCPLRENCYRFKAKPNMYQSYFTKSPYENEKCGYFLNFFEKTDVCKKCGRKKRGNYSMYVYCQCDKYRPVPIKKENNYFKITEENEESESNV